MSKITALFSTVVCGMLTAIVISLVVFGSGCNREQYKVRLKVIDKCISSGRSPIECQNGVPY